MLLLLLQFSFFFDALFASTFTALNILPFVVLFFHRQHKKKKVFFQYLTLAICTQAASIQQKTEQSYNNIPSQKKN